MPAELKCMISLRTCVDSYFPLWSSLLVPRAHKILQPHKPKLYRRHLVMFGTNYIVCEWNLTSPFQGLPTLCPWTLVRPLVWFSYCFPLHSSSYTPSWSRRGCWPLSLVKGNRQVASIHLTIPTTYHWSKLKLWIIKLSGPSVISKATQGALLIQGGI